ncbi:MAG TPA: alpha-amylase family glycosyl hydrolase [Candidatus Dormibacteraeota bacterium]
MSGAWWREGVLYQVYPRSYMDSDGDGVGDLNGIRARLDHLAWLGVDGIWLSPTFPSPNKDWGYDVADYRGVHPDLGSLADLDALIQEAAARGIRVLLDLVPNHTSDQHPWFTQHRDWYVWRPPGPGGEPPNNWRSAFGGPAWTLDERTGQMYLHQFLSEQPDLDWWNEEVRAEFDDILRYWFARGVAGVRIDTAHLIVKDRELRDNPPADETDHPYIRRRGWKPVHTANQPEVHDVLKRWRRICGEFDPEPVLVGETYVLDVGQLAPYYGSGDELHLAFNFRFLHAGLDAAELSAIVEQTEAVLPSFAWPVWTASNHDVSRFPTRWAHGSGALTRCALMLLLTLRGTPFLYQGDEIGMQDGVIPPERVLDPARVPRDIARTPMQWTGAAGAGFTSANAGPWLPFGDFEACNVADQLGDRGSTLWFVRDLIELRRRFADKAYAVLPAPPGCWAWRRGEYVIALNLGSEDGQLRLGGRVLVGTDRRRDGTEFDGHLGPAEGVLLAGNG